MWDKKKTEILDVNYEFIKKYDYKEPIDLSCTLLWLEKLYSNYSFDLSDVKITGDENFNNIKNFLMQVKK